MYALSARNVTDSPGLKNIGDVIWTGVPTAIGTYISEGTKSSFNISYNY